jgi:hypothetical protein
MTLQCSSKTQNELLWAGCSLSASHLGNPVGLVLKIQMTPK